jgi:hypothetical protein
VFRSEKKQLAIASPADVKLPILDAHGHAKQKKKHAGVWLGFTRDARVRNVWREGPGDLTLKV